MVNAAKVTTQIFKFHRKQHNLFNIHSILLIKGCLRNISGYNLFLQIMSAFFFFKTVFYVFLPLTGLNRFGPVFLQFFPVLVWSFWILESSRTSLVLVLSKIAKKPYQTGHHSSNFISFSFVSIQPILFNPFTLYYDSNLHHCSMHVHAVSIFSILRFSSIPFEKNSLFVVHN